MNSNRNMMIVVSNPVPHREAHYPRTWLLYLPDRQTVKVHVAHEGEPRPRVVDKSAA